jgi:hypothetical protein
VKRGWYDINGKKMYFHSEWEAIFARYLDYAELCEVIVKWEKEPETFWFDGIKRGVRSYLPDFKVYEPGGTHWWAEVKGYYDAKTKTKLKRFKKYYPNEKLIVFDKEWFKKNKEILESKWMR